MTLCTKRFQPLPFILLVTALFCSLAFPAQAQRWEYTYLNAGATAEVGAYGIRPVTTGGYIAVGSVTLPGGGGCNNLRDVLVVRINANGTLGWANSYDIGGCTNDDGMSILECAFGGAFGAGGVPGDFAICGEYRTAAGTSDAFVMRINALGGVVWTTGYTAGAQSSGAVRMIEATVGGGTTVIGDLVFCGYSTGNALLTRVSGFGATPGAIVWQQTYSVAALPNTFGRFMDLTECIVGGTPGARGNIAAVGEVSNFPAVIRVNGTTGLIGAAPQGLAFYYNRVGICDPPVLITICELRDFNNGLQGHLVVAGMTRNTQDVYVLRMTNNPCTPVVDITHGDQNGASIEAAYDIEEILPPSFSGSALTRGNLILAGNSDRRAGDYDAMLMEIEPIGLTLVAPPAGAGYNVYDVPTVPVSVDYALSVSPTYVPAGGGVPTDGFIICGAALMTPPPGGIGSEMYVIKTDAVGSSFCDEGQIPDVPSTPANWRSCETPNYASPLTSYSLTVSPVIQSGANQLCYSVTKAVQDPGSGGSLSIAPQPNPVRKGSMIEFTCTTTDETPATITVTDISGKLVQQTGRTLTAGANQISMSTKGWASGSYVFTVKVGEMVRSEIVVVK